MTAFVSKHHSNFSLDRTVAFSKARAGSAFLRSPEKFLARSVSRPALHRPARSNDQPYFSKFLKARGASVFLRPPKNSKAGGSFGLAPRFAQACGRQWLTMLPEILQSTRGASAFLKPRKNIPSGRLVRSRH